ncbi:MAG: cytochrome c-type biogenesis protein [Solirubrobacteraceae bacterium]
MAVTIALLATIALAAGAGAAEPRTTLPDVEDEVMCVVCGTPLNLAQAPQADRERALIQRLIDQGATKDQIKERLEAEYGETVIAQPQNDGFGLAAYLVPLAVAVLALALLAAALARWRRRRGRAAGDQKSVPPEPSRAEARRLDEELARFEG